MCYQKVTEFEIPFMEDKNGQAQCQAQKHMEWRIKIGHNGTVEYEDSRAQSRLSFSTVQAQYENAFFKS